MTALSALLVFGSIAVFATIYAGAGHKQSVLVVTKTVHQGEVITAGDLGSAAVSISGVVHPVPVSDAPSLSGRRASVTIPAGSLLTLADTTTAPPIAAGDAVVGLALKAGQLPSSGVQPGDRVMIVETGAAGAPVVSSTSPGGSAVGTSGEPVPSDPSVLVPSALVFELDGPPPGAPSASGGTSAPDPSAGAQLVSVEVANADAPAVSTAAAAGQISLVLLPSSPSPAKSNSSGGGNGAGGPSGGGEPSGSGSP